MQVFHGECRYGTDQFDRILVELTDTHFMDCRNRCLTTYACTAFDIIYVYEEQITCRLYKGGPYTYATPCKECGGASVVCYVPPTSMYLFC